MTAYKGHLKIKKILSSCIFVIIYACAVLVVFDLGLYLYRFLPIDEKRWRKMSTVYKYYPAEDRELGYIPALGKGIYNLYGTQVNHYEVKKSSSVRRILFIGDSVTEEGFIIKSLKKLYGEDHYEYWNAGVRGYNTQQELAFYRRYNYPIKADQVILTFCLNDFMITPVVYLGENNRLFLYSPYVKNVNRLLYKYSYFYRSWFRFKLKRSHLKTHISTEKIKEDLVCLKQEIKNNSGRFSVIIIPKMSPYDEWPDIDKESREAIIQILEELRIEYYDLLPVLINTLKAGVGINKLQTPEGDTEHPSYLAASIFAQYLYENKIFK